MGLFSKKKKDKSATEDLHIDTPAGSTPTGLPPKSSSFSVNGWRKSPSFSLGRTKGRERDDDLDSTVSNEQPKPDKTKKGSLFKVKKSKKDKGGKTDSAEIEELRREIREKTDQLEAMRAAADETAQKAKEWKEYSNMQRFKAEVMVDMWALRMVNGDGELDTIPLPRDS